MHGVAPLCAIKQARPALGGEAGVSSPGFISFALVRSGIQENVVALTRHRI